MSFYCSVHKLIQEVINDGPFNQDRKYFNKTFHFQMARRDFQLVFCLLAISLDTTLGFVSYHLPLPSHSFAYNSSLFLQIRVNNITCLSDENLCSNLVCQRIPIKRAVYRYELGCTPGQVLDGLKVRVALLIKTSAGYQPSLMDASQNFCDMSNRESTAFRFIQTMMSNFASGYFEKVADQIPTCPVSVTDCCCS
jgi:hypothetical protein